MIDIVWNARCLRGQRAFQNFNRLMVETNPDFLFVAESCIFQNEAFSFKSRMKFDNYFMLNPRVVKAS